MPTIIDDIQITPDELCTELCGLDTSKACGPDNITPFLLKNTADFFAFPFASSFTNLYQLELSLLIGYQVMLFLFTSVMISIALVTIGQLALRT